MTDNWLLALQADLAAQGLVVVEKKKLEALERIRVDAEEVIELARYPVGERYYRLQIALAAYREAGNK